MQQWYKKKTKTTCIFFTINKFAVEYGDKVKMFITDTDRICYVFENKNFYEDF